MILTHLPEKHEIQRLPNRVTAAVTRLSATDHKVFLKKRGWLQKHTVLIPADLERRGIPNPANATLVFAQEEAGTAVCVSPCGVLLTCSHCVAETEDELDWDKLHWLLLASGDAVAAKTIAWDAKRDLALLIIVQAPNLSSPFPFHCLSAKPVRPRARLVCVGHPGSEDLEETTPGVQTNYDTLVLSMGTYRGLAPGQDPHDNSEIGALMHDCWTYWGHSGAPLIERDTGYLVGLHSSWDDQTAMRRGVTWEALKAFADEVVELGVDRTPGGWVWFAESLA
jgi:hypothetical protein